MRERIRNNIPLLVTAMVLGIVTAAAPTVAAAVYDAVNADKVDGKHAVGAGASVAQRAGKLVATNSGGRLPNNVIVKAPDADRLDGLSSNDLLVTGGGASGGYPNVPGCTAAPVVSYALNLDRPARILATAWTSLYVDAGLFPSIQIQLVDSGDQVVARSDVVRAIDTSGNPTLDISEVLFDASANAPYDAAPGAYTLRILGSNDGTCDNTKFAQYQSPRLTHVLLATGH